MIQLPDIRQPIIDSSGLVDKDWYDYLDQVTKDIEDLKARVTVLETP